MDHLNIESLSQRRKEERTISIESLYRDDLNFGKNPPRVTKPTNFNPDDLIKTQEEMDQRITDTYEDVYNLCIERIQHSNKMKNFDLIFEIPSSLYGNLIFDFDECADYLIKCIRENLMDVTRVSRNKLFITWHNIRVNKKIKEMRDKMDKKKH